MYKLNKLFDLSLNLNQLSLIQKSSAVLIHRNVQTKEHATQFNFKSRHQRSSNEPHPGISSQTELTERLRDKNKFNNQVSPSIRKVFPIPSVEKRQTVKNFKSKKNPTLEKLEARSPVCNKQLKPSCELESTERNFLSKVSFKIHNEEGLGENAKKLLENENLLRKTSTNPKHLTLVHDSLVNKWASLIYERTFNGPETASDNNIFVNLQPGFGLVSKNLAQLIETNQKSVLENQNKTKNSFIFIEAFSNYFKYLDQLKREIEPMFNVQILKGEPFENQFLYGKRIGKQRFGNALRQLSTITSENSSHKLSVFGIVPWNHHGYLNRLYSDFLSHSGIFYLTSANLKKPTSFAFYFYVSELMLAKLRASTDKRYSSLSSITSVFSDLFSTVEVLSEDKCDYFFPLPLVATPNKMPYSRLNMHKMYLISIKFRENSILVDNRKRLFQLFMWHLYARPHISLNDALDKSLSPKIATVCSQLGISKSQKVSLTKPIHFLRLFNYLVENETGASFTQMLEKEISHENRQKIMQKEDAFIKQFGNTLSNLKNLHKPKYASLDMLREINNKFSGRFIVPEFFSVKNANKDNDQHIMVEKNNSENVSRQLLGFDKVDNKNLEFNYKNDDDDDDLDYYDIKKDFFGIRS